MTKKILTRAIPETEWKWFGIAGHFICGQWCRFHLYTQVGKYVISTVGEYVHPSDSGGNEIDEAEWLAKNPFGREIGAGRKCETMVFPVGKICRSKECNCGIPEPKIEKQLDGDGYNTRKSAQVGHLRLCKEYAAKGVK